MKSFQAAGSGVTASPQGAASRDERRRRGSRCAGGAIGADPGLLGAGLAPPSRRGSGAGGSDLSQFWVRRGRRNCFGGTRRGLLRTLEGVTTPDLISNTYRRFSGLRCHCRGHWGRLAGLGSYIGVVSGRKTFSVERHSQSWRS